MVNVLSDRAAQVVYHFCLFPVPRLYIPRNIVYRSEDRIPFQFTIRFHSSHFIKGTTIKPTANDADDAELAWINAKLDKAKTGETVGVGEYSRGQ